MSSKKRDREYDKDRDRDRDRENEKDRDREYEKDRSREYERDRNIRDNRDNDREKYRNRENNGYRDNRDNRENRDNRDNRGSRDNRENNGYRDNKEFRYNNSRSKENNENQRNNRDDYKKKSSSYSQEDEDHKRLRELQKIDESKKSHSRREINDSEYEYGRRDDKDEEKIKQEKEEQKKNKEKPDFKPSGILMDDLVAKSDASSNKPSGVVMKWNEPSEARMPRQHWILYPFKGKESLEPYYLHTRKSFLIGRDRNICDIPSEHPSCSSQHAVIVFRLEKKKDDQVDEEQRRVLPYLIDLDSTNGTLLNDKKITTCVYVELRSKDVLKFANSTREYVLLHEDDESD